MRTGTTILLVDDEPLVREELSALLQDEGYEVSTGSDGEEGLKLFRQIQPDMVITDVRMPRRDGLSFAMAIRHEDPSIPITIITGHGNEAMAIEALRAGVTDFIKKPVRLEDLTAALIRMEAVRSPIGPNLNELPSAVELVTHEWVYKMQNNWEAIPAFVNCMLKTSASGMDRATTQELSLALRELLTNAIEHGNLELSYREKTKALEMGTLNQLLRERAQQSRLANRRVTITVQRAAHRLQISVADEGKGFDWRTLPDPANAEHLLNTHGRGVLLAQLLVDSLQYNEAGNEVTIIKGLNPSA